MSRAAAKPLCVVTIGFTSLLLPAAEGARLMTMLAGAVEVDHDYKSAALRGIWEVKPGGLRLEMEMVSADRVRMPEGSVPDPVGPVRRLK